HPRQTPPPTAPTPLPDHPRAARRAGTTVLSGRRARRPVGARGAARSRRGADRRRRRQGPGARAVAAQPYPGRAHADRLGPPGRPPSGRVVAPRRGQRRPGSALSRPTAPADRRGDARDRRRSDHQPQRDPQPRQADVPRPTRRLHTATEVGEMTPRSRRLAPPPPFAATPPPPPPPGLP